jgi:hypothetical protein
MATGSTNPGDQVAADPAAIRAEMTETRTALTRKLGAFKDRVFGTHPSPPETRIMARKKAQSEAPDEKTRPAAAKKSRAAHAPKKAKGEKAEGGSKKKTAAKKAVTARGTSRTTAAAKKGAAPKTSPKRPSSSRRGKPHESTMEKVETKATEVLGDMLAGAAAGAIQGAATAAAPHVESAVGRLETMSGSEEMMPNCENRSEQMAGAQQQNEQRR